MRLLARLVHRAVVVVVLVAVVATLDGCTHGVDDAPSSSPEPVPEKALPLRVVTRVTGVAGTLSPARRDHLARVTRRIVGTYVRSALLDGEAPSARTGFTGFTAGARRLAERDRGALTLPRATAAAVAPRRVAAYLSVLAPHGRMVGATARLEVLLRVEEAAGARPVRLSGRLLLTPTPTGVKVFGYDLQRSGAAS